MEQGALSREMGHSYLFPIFLDQPKFDPSLSIFMA
jgi:hypothetical protein